MNEQKMDETTPIPNAFSLEIQKQISESAYYRWLQRGLQPDDADKNWLEAEEEVLDSLRETRK